MQACVIIRALKATTTWGPCAGKAAATVGGRHGGLSTHHGCPSAMRTLHQPNPHCCDSQFALHAGQLSVLQQRSEAGRQAGRQASMHAGYTTRGATAATHPVKPLPVGSQAIMTEESSARPLGLRMGECTRHNTPAGGVAGWCMQLLAGRRQAAPASGMRRTLSNGRPGS